MHSECRVRLFSLVLVLDRQELLRGPLLYIGIVTAVTILFWRESPVGLMVLSLMCGGDGLADIVGRRYGFAKLPFNHDKSWLGSLAMFIGTCMCICSLINVFLALDHIHALLSWNCTKPCQPPKHM